MNTDIKNIKKQTNNIYVNKQTTKKKQLWLELI